MVGGSSRSARRTLCFRWTESSCFLSSRGMGAAKRPTTWPAKSPATSDPLRGAYPLDRISAIEKHNESSPSWPHPGCVPAARFGASAPVSLYYVGCLAHVRALAPAPYIYHCIDHFEHGRREEVAALTAGPERSLRSAVPWWGATLTRFGKAPTRPYTERMEPVVAT
jgi:hypothetical protein